MLRPFSPPFGMATHAPAWIIFSTFFVAGYFSTHAQTAYAQAKWSPRQLESLDSMYKRRNQIRHFCKKLKYISLTYLDEDAKLLKRLRKVPVEFDATRALDHWRFHPIRLSTLRLSGRRSIQQMTSAQRGAFGRKVLECVAIGLHRDNRARSMLSHLFNDRFAAAQFKALSLPDSMSPLMVSDDEISQAIRPRHTQPTLDEQFLRQTHNALNAWRSSRNIGDLTDFLQRWGRKLERIDQWFLYELSKMYATDKRHWLLKYANEIQSRFNLHRFDSVASLKDIGQSKLRWHGPRANEFVLGSHFGMRHYSPNKTECDVPSIRTEALAIPEEDYLIDAYLAAAKELRRSCGYHVDRFTAGRLFTIDVRLFVNAQKAASFKFSIGGHVRQSGQLGNVSKFRMVSNQDLYDPVAKRFWANPRKPFEIDADVERFSSPALKGDLDYVRATRERKSRKGRPAQNVVYSTEGGLVRRGVLNDEYVSIEIVDAAAFDRALRAGVPAARRLQIENTLNPSSGYWRAILKQDLDRKTVAGAVEYLRALYQARFQRVFFGLKMAKRQGFDLEGAVIRGDKTVRVAKIAPTVPQAYRAINAHVLDSKCGALNYLISERNTGPQAAILSRAIWKRSSNGCAVFISQAGNRLFVRPEKVTSISCSGKSDDFKCTVGIKIDCLLESPSNKQVPLPAKPGLSRIANQATCGNLETAVSLRKSKWLFSRIGADNWRARPDN